jgi:multiple sugar transport system permease protein
MPESAGFRWLRRIVLSALAAIVGLPLYAMIKTSVTPLRELHGAFSWVPAHLTLSPYAQMWQTVPLAHYLRNSVIVATTATLLALAIAVPAGYALARRPTRGPRAFGLLLLATQAVPGLLFLVPLFLVYAEIGRLTGIELIGSFPGLVLTDLTFALPLATWLLAVHFAASPREVEQAAQLDGAGTVRLLVSIVVPTAGPGIAAAGVFTFLLAWSEILFASILTDDRTATLPVGLLAYASESTAYWNQLTGAALITSIPVLAGVLAARRFLEREADMISQNRSG